MAPKASSSSAPEKPGMAFARSFSFFHTPTSIPSGGESTTTTQLERREGSRRRDLFLSGPTETERTGWRIGHAHHLLAALLRANTEEKGGTMGAPAPVPMAASHPRLRVHECPSSRDSKHQHTDEDETASAPPHALPVGHRRSKTRNSTAPTNHEASRDLSG